MLQAGSDVIQPLSCIGGRGPGKAWNLLGNAETFSLKTTNCQLVTLFSSWQPFVFTE
jgi:hypothetical protein